jgi:hypothetical protein
MIYCKITMSVINGLEELCFSVLQPYMLFAQRITTKPCSFLDTLPRQYYIYQCFELSYWFSYNIRCNTNYRICRMPVSPSVRYFYPTFVLHHPQRTCHFLLCGVNVTWLKRCPHQNDILRHNTWTNDCMILECIDHIACAYDRKPFCQTSRFRISSFRFCEAISVRNISGR